MNFQWANLCGMYLCGADLTGADLRGANLHGADLAGADLTGADLAEADLTRADLIGANLAGADLTGANLAGAYLAGTILDPTAPTRNGYTALVMAGVTVAADGYVYGWRTRRSRHVGSTVYEVGSTYTANALSVSDDECHPGIYFGGTEYPKEIYVRAKIEDTHAVGPRKGVRARRIEVIHAVGPRKGVRARKIEVIRAQPTD